jgi:hypothetical protein
MRREGEYGILLCMTKKLKELLERAEHWPQQAQQKVIEALSEIEQRFHIAPDNAHQLDEAQAQARPYSAS